MDIKIIGLGGIGSVLSNSICQYLNYSKIPDIEIVFIDGDKYEFKNLDRQSFGNFENKAYSKCSELSYKYDKLKLKDFPQFITRENISIIQGGDIVFLCVDNHKTRKIVSDYCSTLNDAILISGGNELIDGNVQIFIRKNGKDLTPSLTKYHPEIENFDDKSPEEKSCEELQKSEPQLLFTNMMVSCFMCSAFFNILNSSIMVESASKFKISEVYFDITKMCADAKVRTV